ncbi:MAG TPA: VTT domain-containing protein [Acidobacteriaceae bacterium]|jgi:membrane protein DedA with SNARE-associated domain/rhodanese-related sulfurtransferase|nr:VTT domain-containing protein [Acidobacteriaceae bacterium]
MALPTAILLTYGYFLIFGWVLLEQLGLPLPATPVLLAAGALSATEHMNFGSALLAGTLACLAADVSWFLFGRRYGHVVLRLLCRFSLESTVCVRRTHDSFGKRGAYTLLFAKFVPGLSVVAPPVAGQTGMSMRRFLVFDAAGSVIWSGSLLLAGRLFGDLIEKDPSVLNWLGQFGGALLILGILGFLASRIYRRYSFLRKFRTARLEPVALKEMLDAGQLVYIVDLRHPLELLPDPFTLPGAHHVSPDALAQHSSEIPQDRDVVLYCTCPSEATAAKTAMTLHKLGIDRVRPLRGGFDEWKRLGFPLDAIEMAVTVQQ